MGCGVVVVVRGWPHLLQNFLSIGLDFPHLEQSTSARKGFPQSPQNSEPSVFSLWQCGHFIGHPLNRMYPYSMTIGWEIQYPALTHNYGYRNIIYLLTETSVGIALYNNNPLPFVFSEK